MRRFSYRTLHKYLIQIALIFILFYQFGLRGESTPDQAPPILCEVPSSDGFWRTNSMAGAGFQSEALCQLLLQSNSEIENLHSLLIIKNGKLISELYFKGKDAPFNKRYGLRLPYDGETTFDANTLHDARSVSKSITSILFGIALDKELLPAIDTSVYSFFPEIALEETDPRRAITWKHILTMSSGLKWREWGYGFFLSNETPLLWKKNLAQYVLGRELEKNPGDLFHYNGGGTALLGESLSRITGKSLRTVATEWLFEPLGIQEFEWVEDMQGRSLPHAGLRLRPRDMAKIGKLMLDGGVWEGKQIVSNQWVEQSLKEQIRTGVTMFRKDGGELGYGYQWWKGESMLGQKRISWNAALGNGGQMIFIIPAYQMLVITTGGGYGDPKSILQTTSFLDRILETLK